MTERTGRTAVRQLATPDRQQPVLRFDWRSPRDSRQSRSMRRCWRAGAVASRVRARRWAGRILATSRSSRGDTRPARRSRSRRRWISCSPRLRSTNGRSARRSSRAIPLAGDTSTEHSSRQPASPRSMSPMPAGIRSGTAGHRRAGRVGSLREVVEDRSARRGCAHWSLRPTRAACPISSDDDRPDARLGRQRPNVAARCSARTWSRCRGASCATYPLRSSRARTARRRRFDCSRPARERTAGATATTAPTVCSSPASRSSAATIPARSARARCCAIRASQAAILETARGGILRRGLAVQRARVAVVTNITADHFGEYGIDDLAGLADTKLVVASTIDDRGLLVLNADDAMLRARADQFRCPIGWFSRNYDDAALLSHRMKGGSTSGVRNGRLIVSWTRGGSARSSISARWWTCRSLSTARPTTTCRTSRASRWPRSASAFRPATVATVLARFGADPTDNPGRLMRYDYRGAQVLIDYAHNPDGLRGLMNVATRLRRTGRDRAAARVRPATARTRTSKSSRRRPRDSGRTSSS